MILEQQSGFSLVQRSARIGMPLTLTALLVLQLSGIAPFLNNYFRSVYALTFAVFLGMLLTSEGVLHRVLSRRVLTFVGEVSYGVYLVHILCLNIAEKLFPPDRGLAIPAYALTCAISIAVAFVIHRTIEKPMIKIGKRLSQKQTSAPITVEPVTEPVTELVSTAQD